MSEYYPFSSPIENKGWGGYTHIILEEEGLFFIYIPSKDYSLLLLPSILKNIKRILKKRNICFNVFNEFGLVKENFFLPYHFLILFNQPTVLLSTGGMFFWKNWIVKNVNFVIVKVKKAWWNIQRLVRNEGNQGKFIIIRN